MNLFIIGARPDGQAKVVLEIILAEGRHQVLGFLDDDPQKLGMLIRGVPVLGRASDLAALATQHGAEGAIVALGHCTTRREFGLKIQALGLELVTTIHPSASIDSDVVLGKGVVVAPGACVVTGSVIGDSTNLLTGCTIDHDNQIGAGVVVSPGVHTSGRVKIGRDVFVGTGAIFLPDAEVGEGAIIGAGAVVLKQVPPGETWAGVPARKLGIS